MNHLQVLRDVEERGLRLTVSGTDLRLQGPQQRVDPELVGRIRSVKAELVGYLTAAAPATPAGYPLTLLQRGYLIGRGDSVEIGNVASHIYHEIDGCWDLGRLESALQAVVDRQGMLRTRFTADGRQVEEPAAEARIDRLDLRGEPESRQRARLAALREQHSHRILPQDRAPMLAVGVTLLARDRMRLHVSHDGLVMDGISMFLFFTQWREAYSGGAEPAGGMVSFADYVASAEAIRAAPPAQRSRRYWLDRLDDLPPHPALPLSGSPAAITRPRFVQYAARLVPAAWDALKARAASAGLTPTGVLLAAYAETLARWGAGRRFTLTTTVANRPPIHPHIADAIGNFSQTLLVEIDIDRRSTFTERARALQARLRRDLDHRHFCGIEVLRELARSAAGADTRMPFTFNSTIGYLRPGVDGSALDLFGPEVYTSSQTPQVWLNAFAFEQHGGVVVQIDAVDGLFPHGMISAMADGYQELLGSLAAEAAWSARTFDLMPAGQRGRRLAANDTAGPLPRRLLHDLVAEQAARSPDAPAVLTASASMSYGELLRRAAHAAAWLQARQLRRDELVGLIMQRGPEQIVGILATLMAGGGYLPLDAGLPAARVDYMLADGRVRLALASTGDAARPGIDTLTLDAAGPVTPGPAGPGCRPVPGAAPDDLAYVLYTSGTTGEPKGVMISHRSIANVVADCNARFGIGPGDRFLAVSAFNFDLSVYDVFGALSAGAALVLPEPDRAADPAHWLELCDAFDVTVWNSVPAIAGLLAEHAGQAGSDGAARLHALRLVMLSGDRIPPALPAALHRVKADLTLMSLGGPTETTIWNISHPIGNPAAGEIIPYGRPNANNRAYILDADGLDAPDWVTGEIYAAGAGLARGYWADEARTAERFSYDERRGERLYRTGDLGRYLPDGNIDITGRSDFQIKINGYRIEAGEVEARLAAIAEVKQAVVVRQTAARGDRLVAHLVPAGDIRPAAARIQDALRAHLPGYMTPQAVIWHDSLPLTRNGKVDRIKLTAMAPDAGTAAAAPAGAGITGLERTLAELWGSVLRVPASAIGTDSGFYDLGGDSLAAARIFAEVRKRFGVGITLDRLHDVQTIHAMAAVVAAGPSSRGHRRDGRGMNGSVINAIVAAPPPAGHRIRFARLDGVSVMTLTELHAAAGRLARGLHDLGIGQGDRIGILASNRLEWVLLDLAALRLGAVTAGFEPGKFDPDGALLTRYRLAVLFTDRQGSGAGIRPVGDVDRLIDDADPADPLPAVRYRPDDVTTIKFTSGSTGEPKGLAARCDSIDSSINAVQEIFGHGAGDNLFVFLPLSLLQQRYWIYSALRFGHDVTVTTYEAAFAALRRSRPTVVMGVPAFYETARRQIESTAGAAPSDEGLRQAASNLFGDRIRYLWTGSAPARPSVLRFFTRAGLPIYEGYGLNETCIVSKNHPGAHREGSVGQLLPGKKVLLRPDGLISVRSEHPVNSRYEYAEPGESERVFGPDGTVRTGDLGYIDEDGFLFIRGRADDVIVLDNGKKVIVRPLEEYLKASPAIEECVVFCPAQTRLVAVVSPAGSPPDEEAIAARLAAANATFSRDEQITGLVIAREPFSIGNGLLTSQFKPRRPQILAAYLTQISHPAHPARPLAVPELRDGP